MAAFLSGSLIPVEAFYSLASRSASKPVAYSTFLPVSSNSF